MGQAHLHTQSSNSIFNTQNSPQAAIWHLVVCVDWVIGSTWTNMKIIIFYPKLSFMNHWYNHWGVMRSWCLTLMLHTWDLIMKMTFIYHSCFCVPGSIFDHWVHKQLAKGAPDLCNNGLQQASYMFQVFDWLSSKLPLHPQIKLSGNKQPPYINPSHQRFMSCQNPETLFHSCLPNWDWFKESHLMGFYSFIRNFYSFTTIGFGMLIIIFSDLPHASK